MANWPFSSDASRLMPFFWLKGEDEATLRQGVQDVYDSGCRAICAESRTHPDFLGETWWRDIGILLDECEKLGMKLWIFDDQHFPSGYAAGAATGTPACRMMMKEKHMDVLGPVKGGAFVVQDDESKLRPGEGVVAVIAARRLETSTRVEAFEDIGGWCLGERIDLTDRIHDGLAYWDVPEGMWRIFVFTASYVAERNPPRCFANPLLPEGGQMMIDTVYEPHYQHFGAYFGKTLAGFFSDEPALRAGRGYHAIIGEYPRVPIPWRVDMPELLRQALGEDAMKLLPGLWFDIGEMDNRRIRYALMDTVSRLYGEHYSTRIGDWCRSHGVEYIGHVIEQNNTHCRIGPGAGHYFRAMSGQDMAGIDIVLHEVRPEMRGSTHAWQSQDFEADDDFFRYMLGQMAVSCAHLDPKKKGRTMCEIFGAYGWQEDGAEMRYLANLMLSRGVNYYVPHAFTLTPFPDKDSPPHFEPRHHPLMPTISRIFGYMSRVGSMIDGGRHISRTAVLYYGEGEWANGSQGCMMTQAVIKALNDRQIECEIVPIDLLEEASFDLLLIPYAASWPQKLLEACQRLQNQGRHVYFIDALPDSLSEGDGTLSVLLTGMKTLPLHEAAEAASRLAPLPYEAVTKDDRIHLYPYEKDGERLYLLFNEDVRESISFTLQLDDSRPVYMLDAETETCLLAKSCDQHVTVEIEPGQLLILRQGDTALPCAAPFACLDSGTVWQTEWDISLRATEDADFTSYLRASEWINITAPEHHPRFSGTVRYDTTAHWQEEYAALDLGVCSGTVTLYLDGQAVATRIAPPYLFRFPVQSGDHQVRIEVTNAPVFAHRDPLSFFACLKPTGIQGPVTLFRKED